MKQGKFGMLGKVTVQPNEAGYEVRLHLLYGAYDTRTYKTRTQAEKDARHIRAEIKAGESFSTIVYQLGGYEYVSNL